MSAAPAVPTTSVRTAPSTRTAGLAILALALGGFAIGTTEFVTMGLLPEIARGVDVTIPEAGHVISAYALGWSSGPRCSRRWVPGCRAGAWPWG